MWRVLVIAAVLWPSHISGLLDGAPLDNVPEAVLLGFVLPALVWLHPTFLRGRVARSAVLVLLAVKVMSPTVLQQQGWCLVFDPPRPMVRESQGKPHAWDIRADWLSADPVCSAIMTRAYRDSFELPVWFYNLPPPDDTPHRDGYGAGDILVRTSAHGYIDLPRDGTLRVTTHPVMAAALSVDGTRVEATSPGEHAASLSRGVHAVHFEAVLAGKVWPIVMAWDDVPMGSTRFPLITLQPPSGLDRTLHPAANWIISGGVLVFVVWWCLAAAAALHAPFLVTWSIASAAAIAVIATALPSQAAWYSAAVIALPLLLPQPRRLMNARGLFMLMIVPWFAYVAAANLGQIGRWTLYGVGNDNFLFQRYSYRVFMQHFWLEGGQATFWNQPLMRWIVGALHMIFGDSSIGQVYWDAAGVAIFAMFAYRIVAASAGFAWALAAAVVPFAMFLLGPTLEFVGFGLSEIASAAFIYLAAFFAIRGRNWRDLAAAGVLVVLGFYTRLNNLPLAAAVAAFAVPLTTPASAFWRPRDLVNVIRWRVVVSIAVALAIGMLLFSLRTWYYTGVFGLFYGTQREYLAVWKPHMTWPEALPAMISSLAMVLTASDPPRVAGHAMPMMAAAIVATAALLNLPWFRQAPLPVAGFFLSGLVGALVTRGWGYEGRFSIHLFGAAAALTAWGLSTAARQVTRGDAP